MIEDLIAQDADHVEGLPRGHGVDQHVAMNANEMLGIQDAVFVLVHVFSPSRSIAASSRYGGHGGHGGHGRIVTVHAAPAQHQEMSAYLTSRVDYFSRKLLASMSDDATKCVLDGGIVAFHEMSVHKSDRER